MLTIKMNGPQLGASSLLKMTDLLKVTGLVVAVLSSCGLSMLAQGSLILILLFLKKVP